MKRELRLEHKLLLKQILTPQLIQSLELLQLPRLELEDALKLELDENPFLKVEQENPQADVDGTDTSAVDIDGADRGTTKEGMNLQEWNEYLLDGFRHYPSVRERIDRSALEELDLEPTVVATKSLFDFLKEQLQYVSRDEREFHIGLEIIGNVDFRGFLHLSAEQIARYLKEDGLEPEATVEEIEAVRKKIMGLSPPGIASRDIREAFLAQLKDRDLADTLAYEIVEKHFDKLKKLPRPRLAEELGVSQKDLEIALSDLRKLSFSPANSYGPSPQHIIPDVIIDKIEGEWRVIYNRGNLPILRVDKSYLELISNSEKLDKKSRAFLREKLERAKAWVDSLEQRRRTIVRTAETILKRQIEFFEKGKEYLKPLTLEDVATEMEVHPSTVHRVARDKFIQTPFGIYPFKYFFTTGYRRSDGKAVSRRTVKDILRQLIEAEDKSKPASDSALVELLAQKGLKVARRTVAKYREELGILPARLRRRSDLCERAG